MLSAHEHVPLFSRKEPGCERTHRFIRELLQLFEELALVEDRVVQILRKNSSLTGPVQRQRCSMCAMFVAGLALTLSLACELTSQKTTA